MFKMAVHVLYADLSRAHFNAAAARPVYVQLPEEDKDPNDIGMCAWLRVSMYGTRDAAMDWATEYGKTFKREQGSNRETHRRAYSLTGPWT